MTNKLTTKNAVPEARAALDQFKYEVANEVGVPLKQGYNGDLTSAQNGYVGGYMVNIISPERHREFKRMEGMRNIKPITVTYKYAVAFA